MVRLLGALAAGAFLMQVASPFSFISIRGHVYQADGTPAAYVVVDALRTDQGHSGPVPSTRTDRNGDFTLDLTSYGSYNVTASQPRTSLGLGTPMEAETFVNLRWGDSPAQVKLRLHVK